MSYYEDDLRKDVANISINFTSSIRKIKECKDEQRKALLIDCYNAYHALAAYSVAKLNENK